MINKILLSLILFSSVSYGSFNGRWTGDGIAKTASASNYCQNIFFRLFLSKDKFKIQDGGYNCSGLSAQYPYSVFTIEGSKLIYQGEISGTISENEIRIFSKEDGFELILTLVGDNLMKAQERWQEGEDFLLVESKLELIK